MTIKFFVTNWKSYVLLDEFQLLSHNGIIEHLPFYFIGCISLLIVGGLIMIRKEIK